MEIQFNLVVFGLAALSVPFVLGLYVRSFRHQYRALGEFFGRRSVEQYLTNGRRRWTRAFCVMIALLSLAVAVSQPRWGSQIEDVPRRGRDIVFLLDVSTSMLAEDLSPNRLSAAKVAISTLVDELREEGGHRLSLITFAGRANLQSPLTHDYTFFQRKLKETTTDSAARKGTQIGQALRQAVEGFGGIEPSYTDIILVTDGEDHDSFPREAAQIAAAAGVTLHAVGLGDPVAGAQVPDPDAPGEYLTYRGEEVISRMDPNLLREIALIGGGKAIPSGLAGIDLLGLYRSEIAPKERRVINATSTESPIKHFHWFVLIALMLLGLEMLIRDRRLAA